MVVIPKQCQEWHLTLPKYSPRLLEVSVPDTAPQAAMQQLRQCHPSTPDRLGGQEFTRGHKQRRDPRSPRHPPSVNPRSDRSALGICLPPPVSIGRLCAIRRSRPPEVSPRDNGRQG